MLFALAALAGSLGYVFDLFSKIVPYDELTHAFTTFSVSLAFYFLFYGGTVPRQRAVALGTSVFTLGVTAGAPTGRSSNGQQAPGTPSRTPLLT